MRNRAKCKLCGDVLESFHQHDYVECGCGEIAIDGGNYSFKASAKHWENFIRLDDDDGEIIPTVIDKDHIDEKLDEDKVLTRDEMIDMLKSIATGIERLPDHAMSLPINHYDFYSAVSIIVAILKTL